MKKTVLIVDDDLIINDMLKQVLEMEGYNVIQVVDGKSALSSVYKSYPDLIILDILLPDIDGYSICKFLKMERETNQIPIIMITGMNAMRNQLFGIRVGADEYIIKPFDMEFFTNKVHETISWKDKLNKYEKEIISFTLNSNLKYIEQLSTFLSISLNRKSISQNEINEIQSGLYEIVTNAIEWGNQFNESMLVQVNYELTAKSVTISVVDEGNGFNCEDFLRSDYHPIDFQDSRINKGKRLGGFGLKMARSFFDDIKYNHLENKITLKRNFALNQ